MKKIFKLRKASFADVTAFIIAIIGIAISIFTIIDGRKTQPLIYAFDTVNEQIVENEVHCTLNPIVTNGCIERIKFFSYQKGTIVEVADYVDLNVYEGKNDLKTELYFSPTNPDDTVETYTTALYALVYGADGSKDLSMILFDVNMQDKTVSSMFYSFENLVLAEKSELNNSYDRIYSEYRELLALFRDDN